jgi:hypothetical protein
MGGYDCFSQLMNFHHFSQQCLKQCAHAKNYEYLAMQFI